MGFGPREQLKNCPQRGHWSAHDCGLNRLRLCRSSGFDPKKAVLACTKVRIPCSLEDERHNGKILLISRPSLIPIRQFLILRRNELRYRRFTCATPAAADPAAARNTLLLISYLRSSRVLKNALLGAAGMRRIIFQTRKCLKNEATRGHVPRESELKKAMNGLFQHPARGQRKKVPPAAAAHNPTSGGKILSD